MRSTSEVSGIVLKDHGRFRLVRPERQHSQEPSPLKVKEVWVGDRRYIVCLNEEQRREDAADREAILAILREKLPTGGKEFVGNKGYRKFLRAESRTHFTLDEDKVQAEARYDGHWVLRTKLADEPEVIAMAYKQLGMVEDVFWTMKSILETRPSYHKRDETIRGHVVCSFLAVMLRRTLALPLEEKGEDWEWGEVRRRLDELHEVEAVFQGHRFRLRSQLVGHAHKAFPPAGVALPPTRRKVE